MVDIDTEHLPEGDEKVARGAVDVRHHRPPLRPGQPGHDVPHGRRLAARARCATCASARARSSLDLACGTGDFCRELERARASARSASTSPSGCWPAARTDAPLVQADALRLPAARRRRSTASPAASPCATWSSSTPFFAELARVRAPRRAHRPARGGRAPEPGAAVGPRHLLRQGRAHGSAGCCPTPPPTATCPSRWPTCPSPTRCWPRSPTAGFARRRAHACCRRGISQLHHRHPATPGW